MHNPEQRYRDSFPEITDLLTKLGTPSDRSLGFEEMGELLIFAIRATESIRDFDSQRNIRVLLNEGCNVDRLESEFREIEDRLRGFQSRYCTLIDQLLDDIRTIHETLQQKRAKQFADGDL